MSRFLNVYLSRYIKLYILSVPIMAILLYATYSIFGDDFTVSKIAFISVVGSSISVFTMAIIHFFSLKENGVLEDDSKQIDVKKFATFTTNISRSELLAKLHSDPVIKKMKISHTKNKMLIKTGITWRSWGEIITITKDLNSSETNVSENLNSYTVTSKPIFPITITDYGKNLENLKRIEQILCESN